MAVLLSACNDAPIAPLDPEATLGEDQFWKGVALIHSATFQDSELIEQIISEARAFNAAGDTLPCNWWSRIVSSGREEINCSWQTVEVFTGVTKLNTYFADSNTIAAILPETAGQWPITLKVRGWRSDLGTVPSYGFSGVEDGPGITNSVLDWPGDGAGTILAKTGPSKSIASTEDPALLRYLNLRSGVYRDFDLGFIYGRPFAPGPTWDPNVVAFSVFESGTDGSPVTYWKLLPTPTRIDTVPQPCGSMWWWFMVSPGPGECVASSKHSSQFQTSSGSAFHSRRGNGALRVEHSIPAERWISLPWIGVWDFAGNEVFRPPNLADGPSLRAAEFSPDGDTLFVSGYSAYDDSLRLRTLVSLDAASGTAFQMRRLGWGGPEEEVDDMLADPDSRWLYLMRGCLEPRLEIVDRATLETVRRIDLGFHEDGFACWNGSLVLSRLSENALYFIMSDGGHERVGTRSRIFRFEIPPAGAGS